ncbi:TetR/AcrR family transcriptional regulator [Romboutsia maritimum]|uniref:TetR/AcrR family transcriptional regulator n=1 Tax=Romboutsia maritimum TaxID=2020948 RepID=A0A371IWQ7_9FIRM|nr:TetR/AcrR family transcriptional regulator [Romboutsia maritimum]RDY24905.1 TetR/AcrR family transcriptional regulator [Romboutsia maritimum]
MKPNNNMKQNILIAATDLITKNGIKNTSLADIANSVGISKGTLYYHYSSKDDIIFSIADSHLNIITDAILNCVQNIKTESPKDKIVEFIINKITTIESTGRVHMYLICEAITGNEPLKERIRVKYIQWRNTLKSEIEKSFIDNKESSEALSFLLISIVDGLVIQSLLKTEKLPYENIATFLINKWY